LTRTFGAGSVRPLRGYQHGAAFRDFHSDRVQVHSCIRRLVWQMDVEKERDRRRHDQQQIEERPRQRLQHSPQSRGRWCFEGCHQFAPCFSRLSHSLSPIASAPIPTPKSIALIAGVWNESRSHFAISVSVNMEPFPTKTFQPNSTAPMRLNITTRALARRIVASTDLILNARY